MGKLWLQSSNFLKTYILNTPKRLIRNFVLFSKMGAPIVMFSCIINCFYMRVEIYFRKSFLKQYCKQIKHID